MWSSLLLEHEHKHVYVFISVPDVQRLLEKGQKHISKGWSWRTANLDTYKNKNEHDVSTSSLYNIFGTLLY